MDNQQQPLPYPWNGECELCYSAHKFQPSEVFFHVKHPFSPDTPINICKICWFASSGATLISTHNFPNFKPSK
jgi:hypothetical protein